MKKSEIVVGGIYGNGKGRIRRVVAEGDYKLYAGQMDCDCLEYEIINDGTMRNRAAGSVGRMTRVRFAAWAKERMNDVEANDGPENA